MQELLEETQRQGEELQAQHEELTVTNEELQTQGNQLREVGARREQAQQELEAANANLEEQTAELEAGREEMIATQHQLEERARELADASRYKSEFLAKMSHELRTPLNSSLILARLLGDNPAGNLTEEQVKFANTIHAAGNDLLVLINDILDLSKIEAGKLELRTGQVHTSRIRDTLLREFEAVAKSRALAFHVDLAPGAPDAMRTDEQRLIQVLRNLVSNACKFTERGEVAVTIAPEGERVTFAVRDTGIGIPRDHLERVFDAFHQVDGSVSRKHGGTGLGLAISRELAALLGGTLEVTSAVGAGTTFTLAIPREISGPPAAAPGAQAAAAGLHPVSIPPPLGALSHRRVHATPPPISDLVANLGGDDRDRLDRGRRTLLVIEDDLDFAAILRDLGRELGYQVLIAVAADEGVAMALRYVPDGILLDVRLPDHSGLSVLERLKRQPATRHIPVHVCSVDDHAQRSLELGAIGYLLKPAKREELAAAIRRIEDRTSKRVRHLLIVEDDAVQAEALTKLLGGEGVAIDSDATIAGALAKLKQTAYDCVVMDLRLADGTGFDLLDRMAQLDGIAFPPVIVHTGKELSEAEEEQLRGFSSSIIVKGARSADRLVDEVTLFLHQVEADLPPERQRLLRQVRDREALFEGRKVLIVEDDVRNVFALSSVLEPRGLDVTIARNGREALDALARNPDIDLVLMDIMMPEMDGLTAMGEIRKLSEHARLPIIALTAKAMASDRQKCLEAGADDYISKPIDVDKLVSLCRVWLRQR
jgi:CheY-like chemotaxis protein